MFVIFRRRFRSHIKMRVVKQWCHVHVFECSEISCTLRKNAKANSLQKVIFPTGGLTCMRVVSVVFTDSCEWELIWQHCRLYVKITQNAKTQLFSFSSLLFGLCTLRYKIRADLQPSFMWRPLVKVSGQLLCHDFHKHTQTAQMPL